MTHIRPNEVHMTCKLSLGIPCSLLPNAGFRYNSTFMSVGRSVKKRSSSLTRVSVGRAQTPAKPDKGTTDDQGG